MLARAGRRRDGDVLPGTLHHLLATGRARRRRALQVVLRLGQRHRLGRRGRHAGAGTALRRPAPRPPDPRPVPGKRDQPGRRERRAERSERAGPAASHPAGPVQRAAVHPGHRCRRGARLRHAAGRPDRSPGTAGHLRPGPRRAASPAARLGEVQHRAHPDRRRYRRRHQNDHGDEVRHGAADPARRPADQPGRLVHRARPGARRGPAVAADRAAPALRRLGLRRERDQRSRHHRAGARGHRTGAGDCSADTGALDPLGAHPHRGPRAGHPAAELRDRRPVGAPGRRRLVAGHRPGQTRAPGRRHRRRPRRPDTDAGGACRGPSGRDRGNCAGWRALGLPVRRAGFATARPGTRASRDVPGLRRRFRPGRHGARPAPRPSPARRSVGHRRGADQPDRPRPGRAVRLRDGALPTPALVGDPPVRTGRAFRRRAGRRPRRRGLRPDRRRPPGGRPGPADAGAARRWRDGRSAGHRGGGHSSARPPGRHGRDQRTERGRRVRRRRGGHRRRRKDRRPGPQDHSAAGLTRLPLGADGTHAGRIRRGRPLDLLRPSGHPHRLRRDRHDRRRRASDPAVLGPPRARHRALRRRGASSRVPRRQPVPRAGPRRHAERDGPGEHRRRRRGGHPVRAPRRWGTGRLRRSGRPPARGRRPGGLERLFRRQRRPADRPADLRLPAGALLARWGRPQRPVTVRPHADHPPDHRRFAELAADRWRGPHRPRLPADPSVAGRSPGGRHGARARHRSGRARRPRGRRGRLQGPRRAHVADSAGAARQRRRAAADRSRRP